MTRAKPFSIQEKELILSRLEADQSSPSGLRWKTRVSQSIKAGDVAGCKQTNKYGCTCWSVGLKGRWIKAHNILWFLWYGEDPALLYPLTVDHDNRDGSDNSKSNLFLRDKRAQTANRTPRKKSSNATSSYQGVHWCSKSSRWVAKWRHPLTRKVIFAGQRKPEGEAYCALLSSRLEQYDLLNGKFQDGGILQPCYATNR